MSNENLNPQSAKVKPWEKIGISRATWYRYGKPTEKAVYEDQKWDKRGGLGGGTTADWAADLKKFGFSSIRTYQRAMRVCVALNSGRMFKRIAYR